MKLKTALAAVGAAILYATPAFCAEGAEDTGSWATLLFYIINFAIFAYIVGRYASPMVRKFFADRSGSIREVIGRADSSFKQAQELANKAAARAAQLENEVKRLVEEWDQETAYRVKRIGELAREAAQRIRRDTELTASALAEESRRRVRARLAASATSIARDMVQGSLDASDHRRLLDDFVERLQHESPR